MFSQEFLQREAERRAQWTRKCANRARNTDLCAVAVVSRFSPAVFVESSYGFAARLSPEMRTAWCASYTRTVYLAGDPENISVRFPPNYCSVDGSIAWFGPDTAAAMASLRKLLRPLVSTFEIGDAFTVVRSVDGARLSDRTAVLALERRETTAERYSIHSNHVVSEALAMGLLDATDSIQLRLVDRIDPEDGPYDYLRVAADRDRPESLRCYAGLTVSPRRRECAQSSAVDIGAVRLSSLQ
ncbi:MULTISPECIES: DUF6182 family protein [Rhodococcus]|uniref:DUF6182 family protein n=1 Tax=Rhodococcus TaxID=1827 RepID=UPI001C59AB74|nr:DUF6182 family protein [Rhodococcus sp. LW-XY12]QXU55593.1 hypothetical protein KXC42_10570 [Rhodococcus sp. LW-XY12]